MRKIKYRVWSPDHEKFITDDPMWHYRVMDDLKWGEIFLCPKWKTDDSIIFQQYTGLKDKNGVEIYEGDICKYEYDHDKVIGEIVFDECFLSYGIKIISNDRRNDDFYNISQSMNPFIEVIGNIFENQELLNTEG